MSHFVFSSVERGGEIDDKDAILDRLVKIHIENHVKSLGEKGLKWTQVDSCLLKLLELTSITRTEFYDRASSPYACTVCQPAESFLQHWQCEPFCCHCIKMFILMPLQNTFEFTPNAQIWPRAVSVHLPLGTERL